MSRIHAKDCTVVTVHKGWKVIELPPVVGGGFLIRKADGSDTCSIVQNSLPEAINAIDLREPATVAERAQHRAMGLALGVFG